MEGREATGLLAARYAPERYQEFTSSNSLMESPEFRKCHEGDGAEYRRRGVRQAGGRRGGARQKALLHADGPGGAGRAFSDQGQRRRASPAAATRLRRVGAL